VKCGGVVCCRRHLILSCQGSLNIFPFDDPLCSFAMESSEYLPSAKCPAAAPVSNNAAFKAHSARKKERFAKEVTSVAEPRGEPNTLSAVLFLRRWANKILQPQGFFVCEDFPFQKWSRL
jgi:hypothetical protein